MKRSMAIAVLHELEVVGAISARYSQIMRWRWLLVCRILVVVNCAVLASVIAIALLGDEWRVILASISVLWIVAFTVHRALQAKAVSTFYQEQYEEYCIIARSSGWMSGRLKDSDAETIDDDDAKQINELREKLVDVEVEEFAPWRGLMLRCQEDHNEATYGPGVRTYQQVVEHLQRKADSTDQEGAQVAT